MARQESVTSTCFVGRPRPRLLILSQTLPFPPDSGVKSRTFNVLRQLARGYDITALCFWRRERRTDPTDVDGRASALEPYATIEAFRIPQEWSSVRLLRDHLASVLRRRAYILEVYDSSRVRRRLRALLLGDSFDLVHADSLDLAGYFQDVLSLPLICVHHDVQSRLLHRRARAEGGWLRSRYLHFQAGLVEREERRWLDRVTMNVVVSETDLAAYRQLVPSAPLSIVPNGVDLDYFRPGGQTHRDGIVFVGSTTWFPNRDGMLYFVREILPLIRVQVPGTKLRWVGAVQPDVTRSVRRVEGVELLGHLQDIRPALGSAACAIVPLRVGGGTRVKILEAWAMGVPVVSTTIGCEGLEARSGENLLVADGPQAFADAVVRLLTNPALRGALGHAGRATVETQYDWDRIGVRMLELYELCRTSRGS